MKAFIQKQLKNEALLIVLALLVGGSLVYAASDIAYFLSGINGNGFIVLPNGSATVRIDSDKIVGGTIVDCRKVTNNGSSPIFVPTNSHAEWISFINYKPSNVVVSPCTYDPTVTFCGNSDEHGPVDANILWQQVGNLRYYIGNSGGAADDFSCIGVWDEVSGMWLSSKFMKYADQRQQLTSALAWAVFPGPFPACPAGMQQLGEGCVAGCSGVNQLDHGYCMVPASYCGDGLCSVNGSPYEQYTTCPADCPANGSVCGDGIIQSNEQCDGNTTNAAPQNCGVAGPRVRDCNAQCLWGPSYCQNL